MCLRRRYTRPKQTQHEDGQPKNQSHVNHLTRSPQNTPMGYIITNEDRRANIPCTHCNTKEQMINYSFTNDKRIVDPGSPLNSATNAPQSDTSAAGRSDRLLRTHRSNSGEEFLGQPLRITNRQ